MLQADTRWFGPALSIGLAAAVMLIAAQASLADLCPKCQGMMFTTDIGKCTVCGGHDHSGAFKLCKACSANWASARPAARRSGPRASRARSPRRREGPCPGAGRARRRVTLATPTGNAFAADLYAKLAAQEGNLFFSPFSIDVALAMTYAGARGKTADEMAEVLHLPTQERVIGTLTFDGASQDDSGAPRHAPPR